MHLASVLGPHGVTAECPEASGERLLSLGEK